MPRIKIQTQIKADIEVVFDLSRSIDLHVVSTEQSNEKAIGGKTTGLIGLSESVTWRAKHFGVYQNLTSKITEFEKPTYFADEMQKGAFKSFRHEHHFTHNKDGILTTDIFEYTSPLGFIGHLADKLFLKKYMINLLEKRNHVIKEYAENGKKS